MTNFLNLDEVESAVDFTLKLNGKEHALVESTVEDFIANTKAIEKLGTSASVVEELELTMQMIMRAFPTIKKTELGKLKLSQLNEIVDFARTANGEKAEQVEEDAKGAEGNAPAAS